jgi:hypothetical protein
MIPQETGSSATIIGIDFDNTLAIYDELVLSLAIERGFIEPDAQKNKKDVRDTLRGLPNGEIEWQKLQGVIYGPRMGEARISPDVAEFIRLCRNQGAKLHIVSHKTELANFDETKTNLRDAAMQWMHAHKFFEPSGFGFSQEDVTFVGTRREKSVSIQQLGCTHFIDDLEEVFQESLFPSQVHKILFANQAPDSDIPDVSIAETWNQVGGFIFPDESCHE